MLTTDYANITNKRPNGP